MLQLDFTPFATASLRNQIDELSVSIIDHIDYLRSLRHYYPEVYIDAIANVDQDANNVCDTIRSLREMRATRSELLLRLVAAH